MDANGTRYHLKLGYDDWASCADDLGVQLRAAWEGSPIETGADELAWDAERNELTLRPRLFQFIPSPKDTPPGINDRRGAARDRFGNWYWIDQSGHEILVHSAGSRVTSHFWSVRDCAVNQKETRFGEFQPREARLAAPPLRFSGLAVTAHHYLIAGVLEPNGLLIFDLHAGGAPRQIVWPKSFEFIPFDMAPAPGGGLWVLDRAGRRYLALDRHFNIVVPTSVESEPPAGGEGEFRPTEDCPSDEVHLQPLLSVDDAFPVAALDPVAIEALPDGTVMILDRYPDPSHPFSTVYRYRFGQQLGEPVSTDVMLQLTEIGERPFTLVGHDFAFAPDHAGQTCLGRLYVAAAEGNQSYAFTLCQHGDQIDIHPLTDYLPMRLFGGKGLVTAGLQVYYDFGDVWIPLVEQRRPRFSEEGVLVTPPFDGAEPDCVWHRLMLDACIPAEALVEVSSRAANDPGDMALCDWRPEPRLSMRRDGSELPFVRSSAGADDSSTSPSPARATWELLFQRARGRYLQLRLLLRGDGRVTPRLRALRAYYPRFSYLDHYLPAVYREDRESGSFLDRFLANVEGFYTTIEDKVAAVQMLFDVRSAPPDVLEWLASWFGVALDPAWDENRRRLFIRHAMDFFQYRGTIRGLEMALRLALDDCADETTFSEPGDRRNRSSGIRIIEKYRARKLPRVSLGDPTDVLSPVPVSPADPWKPDHGGAQLHRLYNDALKPLSQQPVFQPFPISDPGGNAGPYWRRIAQEQLGFIPFASADERKRWQDFLASRYQSIAGVNEAHHANWLTFASISLPNDIPSAAEARQDWLDYLKRSSASAIERGRWQGFLARRYQRISELNRIYKTNWISFDSVSLPDDLPADGGPLRDWYQFEAVVLPINHAAHRFTVLVPMPASVAPGPDRHEERRRLAERVIMLEKPAHTIFDVKFYWAYFRLGAVRLGHDTVVDVGSRAPQLMSPLILGRGYLAESFLAPRHPQDVLDRVVLERDQLNK